MWRVPRGGARSVWNNTYNVCVLNIAPFDGVGEGEREREKEKGTVAWRHLPKKENGGATGGVAS